VKQQNGVKQTTVKQGLRVLTWDSRIHRQA